MLLLLPAFFGVGCSSPPPPKPPPPPPFERLPVSEPEKLAMVARSMPAAEGGRSIEIFINGQRVVQGTLSAPRPHGSFHGDYEGHDVLADCTLRTNVVCSVSIDGEPAGGEP